MANGKRFTGDTLLALIKGLHEAGKVFVWEVTEPAVQVNGTSAWITYVNKDEAAQSGRVSTLYVVNAAR